MQSENKSGSLVARATHTIHKYFLPLLLASYVLASFLPQFGLAIRQVSIGTVNLPLLGAINVSLPLIMLSFLLFNAGLGIQVNELVGLRRKPQILLAAFAANLVIPILLIVSSRSLLGLWHSSDELHNLIVGLALIIAMPIAGSSAAWAQNANGNLSLSLGLILLSTILSPVTTPAVLDLFGFMTQGDYAEDLHEMARQGTNAFLCLTVVLPSLVGIATHFMLGDEKTNQVKPTLKLINFIVLLLLNYSNAATSLPQAFRVPDWDFLAFIMAATITVCLVAFAAGWLVARAFNTNKADRAALIFGLGMNNNGTGLVLAATALADHPAVMLPMIFYTLVQQVAAAVIDWCLCRKED